MPRLMSPADRKIAHTVALTPRVSSYIAREAKYMQISVPEYLRQLIDREIERRRRDELTRDRQRLRIPGSG